MQAGGPLRLWRGVSTMFTSCVPAHALYFSSYEYAKAAFGAADPLVHNPWGAAGAGCVATFFHDVVMTPADVVKQRLQLGRHSGLGDCVRTVLRREGIGAFYRSFPPTLLMNLPYAAVMVSSNESIKRLLNPSGEYNIAASLAAGSLAGGIAAAATTPLDVIKTRLQVTPLAQLLKKDSSPAASSAVRMAMHTTSAARDVGMCAVGLDILSREGVKGLWRGIVPRVALAAPAVGISWSAYEAGKWAMAPMFA